MLVKQQFLNSPPNSYPALNHCLNVNLEQYQPLSINIGDLKLYGFPTCSNPKFTAICFLLLSAGVPNNDVT